MSFHNKPNYQIPELIEALKAHRLPHDTPSQLADSFRIGWMARASHGQAQADAKALAEADRRAGEAERLLATCKEDVMRFEQVRSRMKYQWGADQRVSFDEVWDEALALKKAAQADSVQEDAARLDWLEQNLFHREMDEWDVKFGGRVDQNMWVLFAPKGVQGSARRIIDAARKQGEKP